MTSPKEKRGKKKKKKTRTGRIPAGEEIAVLRGIIREGLSEGPTMKQRPQRSEESSRWDPGKS